MSRPSKGPRLYLYRRKGREPVYIIRDGTHRESTGCSPHDSERAHEAFKAYCVRTFRPNTKERDLARIKVSEVLMLYGQDIAPASPSRETIGYHIKALLSYWGDKTLEQVKGSTCRAYLKNRTTSISDAGLSPTTKSRRCVSSSTVRRELKTLSAAINHWHGESPLPAVPKVTLPEEGGRRERFLERSEAAALLRAARRLGHKHIARFILIGLYTGTRHNAILSLRWLPSLSSGHVDLERMVIFRRGSAERETSKRRPPVRIAPTLARLLSGWKRSDAAQGIAHVIHYQGQAIHKERRAFAAVVKEAGLGKDITPHVLRHTCATWALWSGMTIWDVAGLIGADASTVERVYGHHRIAAEVRRKLA